jgi:predicted PurR-regulated permease PerM
MRISAVLGWRLLVVAAALYVVSMVVAYLAALVVPVAIALLLAALLAPSVANLVRRRVRGGRRPRSLSSVGWPGWAES